MAVENAGVFLPNFMADTRIVFGHNFVVPLRDNDQILKFLMLELVNKFQL